MQTPVDAVQVGNEVTVAVTEVTQGQCKLALS